MKSLFVNPKEKAGKGDTGSRSRTQIYKMRWCKIQIKRETEINQWRPLTFVRIKFDKQTDV